MLGSLTVGLLAAALIGGCATRYVVLTHVPENPTFTVIPGSVSKSNMEFANTVTAALVSCGVRVVERPAILAGYAESQGSVSGIGAVGGTGGEATIGVVGGSGKQETTSQSSDVVDLYQRTSADYVIVAFATDSWLKVVRRESKEILFGGSLRRSQSGGLYRSEMTRMLRAMGVATRR
jgi:hypothetical protein